MRVQPASCTVATNLLCTPVAPRQQWHAGTATPVPTIKDHELLAGMPLAGHASAGLHETSECMPPLGQHVSMICLRHAPMPARGPASRWRSRRVA